MVDVRGQFVPQAESSLDFFEAGVLARGFFEVHLLAQTVAGRFDRDGERASASCEELRHPIDLVAVLINADYLLARAQAHVHLAVNAAGVLGRWIEILTAAAHLEEVAETGFEFIGGRARSEGAVVESRRTAYVRGHLAAREGVVEDDLDVGGEAQAQQLEVGFREVEAGLLIEAEGGFERRAAGPILDALGGLAEV